MTGLPRREPGETRVPLWWATEATPWDVDLDGSRSRWHKWVRRAGDGSVLAQLDLFESVEVDGRRALGEVLLFGSDVEVDATDPDDIRVMAGVLESASSVLRGIAERGVGEVAR